MMGFNKDRHFLVCSFFFACLRLPCAARKVRTLRKVALLRRIVFSPFAPLLGGVK
jgi:hypothetical protein